MHAFSVDESNVSWEPGLSINAGLIFEKMFTNRLGIHSGFWFMHGRINFTSPADGTGGFSTSDAYVDISTLVIPADLIVSFNAGFFSFNLLTGLSFEQIIQSRMKVNDWPADPKDNDFLLEMNYFQIGLDIGFNLKFRVGRFTDLFLGAKGQMMLLPIMKDDNGGDNDNFSYNVQAFAGVMFRMSLFPFK